MKTQLTIGGLYRLVIAVFAALYTTIRSFIGIVFLFCMPVLFASVPLWCDTLYPMPLGFKVFCLITAICCLLPCLETISCKEYETPCRETAKAWENVAKTYRLAFHCRYIKVWIK